MTNNLLIISYLIYIIIWESIAILGTGYIVFILNNSKWWMLLSILLTAAAYSPKRWNELLKNKEEIIK
jgi:hypothetical protein